MKKFKEIIISIVVLSTFILILSNAIFFTSLHLAIYWVHDPLSVYNPAYISNIEDFLSIYAHIPFSYSLDYLSEYNIEGSDSIISSFNTFYFSLFKNNGFLLFFIPILLFVYKVAEKFNFSLKELFYKIHNTFEKEALKIFLILGYALSITFLIEWILKGEYESFVSIMAYSQFNPDVVVFWDVYFMIIFIFSLLVIVPYLLILGIYKKSRVSVGLSLAFFSLLLISKPLIINPWQDHLYNSIVSIEVREACGEDVLISDLKGSCPAKLLAYYGIQVDVKDEANYSKYSIINGEGYSNYVINDNIVYPHYYPYDSDGIWINDRDNYDTYIDLNEENVEILNKIYNHGVNPILMHYINNSLYVYYNSVFQKDMAIKTISDLYLKGVFFNVEKIRVEHLLRMSLSRYSNLELIDYLLSHYHENPKGKGLELKESLEMLKPDYRNAFDYLIEKMEGYHWNEMIGAEFFQDNYSLTGIGMADHLKMIKDAYDKDYINRAKISGRIMLDGKPYSNQRIGLHSPYYSRCGGEDGLMRSKKDYQEFELINCGSVYSFDPNYYPYEGVLLANSVITDESGFFEFDNVGHGIYYLMLGDFNKPKEELMRDTIFVEKAPNGIVIDMSSVNEKLGDILLKTVEFDLAEENVEHHRKQAFKEFCNNKVDCGLDDVSYHSFSEYEKWYSLKYKQSIPYISEINNL